MNEELKKTLNTLTSDGLMELQNWLSSGKDFVSEQTPLVVQEIVNWGIASNTIAVILWSVALLFTFIGLYLNYKFFILITKDFEKLREDEKGVVALPGITTVLNLVLIVITICHWVYYIYRLTFILYAPRLYILEQVGIILNQLGVTR